MSNNSGGPGGCISVVLVVLIIGAAFGIFEWSTVGSFVRFLVYIAIAGIVVIGISLFFGGNK